MNAKSILLIFLVQTFSAYGNDIPVYIHSQYYSDISPPNYDTAIEPSLMVGGQDLIDVDLSNLTWSAFDSNGTLIRSGRISGGKEFCSDIGKNCETITGLFTIYRTGGEDCKSTIYPVGRGGAPMPYCMFFHGGYALHGSNFVPDYNASHGCVRMAIEDAQWLNEEFVQVGLTKVHTHY